jgi:uncharacterized membrane protein
VFLFLNIGFLMMVAFAPFPTRLIAEHIREDGARAAALLYGITLVVMALLSNALWLNASVGGRLLREDHDPLVVRGITRSYRLGPATYLAATLIAIVSPTVSVILFAAIAALYIVESSLFGRTKQRGDRPAPTGRRACTTRMSGGFTLPLSLPRHQNRAVEGGLW